MREKARNSPAKSDPARSATRKFRRRSAMARQSAAQRLLSTPTRSVPAKPSAASNHRWLGHINGWDGNMNWHTNGRTYVSGLKSWHDNRREDRLYNPLVTDIGATQYHRSLTGWVNNMDHQFDYTC